MDTGNDEILEAREEEAIKLKSATHYYVAKICESEAEKLQRNIQKQAVAVINQSFFSWIETYATDIEAFCKHRQKVIVNPSDILLFARKNKDLVEKLEGMVDTTTKTKKRTKKDKEKDGETTKPPKKKQKTS
eukprot:TRINITY_DN3372_c0_g1_i1.p1 TRINITY_DN3372_c0_g1~~TRINITY_DN3372_c0_g1_i1.p1  ORF type:complete len:132 (-),score=27.25 TRINITY_DN3372_c0_g1_i1:186-581(-)